METRRYKNTELFVSLLGLGCMRLPRLFAEKQDIDEAKAQEIVDYAYSHGVNYFDTAYNYHENQSEKLIGRALQKYPRESFCLATKFPVWEVKTQEDVDRIFREQLENCRVEYFDFYLLHAQNAENFEKIRQYGVIEYLDRKKKEGKIRRLGFSFHDKPGVLETICGAYPFDFAQIQLNYLDWTVQDAKRQYEFLTGRGIPVIVMEPVHGGTLADPCPPASALFRAARPQSSVASWAIRYAASLPNVLTVLSGMSTLEQVRDNVSTMEPFSPLTGEERGVIAEALEIYKKETTIPCTGCRYCMECPFGVDIPGVFRAYNDYIFQKDEDLFRTLYGRLPANARAESCRACGACMQHCPQDFDIPVRMKEIAALAEQYKMGRE